jgi:hypothetical protein
MRYFLHQPYILYIERAESQETRIRGGKLRSGREIQIFKIKKNFFTRVLMKNCFCVLSPEKGKNFEYLDEIEKKIEALEIKKV